jgi:hypothetical protein
MNQRQVLNSREDPKYNGQMLMIMHVLDFYRL